MLKENSNYTVYKFIFILLIPFIGISQIPYFETTLPIIIINTNGVSIVDEPKINAAMGIIYNGTGEVNKTTDSFNHYNGKIGIEIRGNSSQAFPKKSYAVETRDQSGENLDVSLLGLPSDNDWVLYGPYSDKTLIRNAIAYKLARQLGEYAPRTKFCELIINNDYIGLYLLIEKIKRSDNRVNISKLKDTDISDNELTGGYIIKIDRYAGTETGGWASNYPPELVSGVGLWYQYHYPSQSDIIPEQKEYIKNWISKFENTIYGNNKYDQSLGYYNYLDMDSVVDYYVINEICKNYDISVASFFLYKDKDSKDRHLHFGPVWDFNLAMGNAWDEGPRAPNGWYSDFYLHPWGEPLGRPFWSRLIWDDEYFRNLFNSRIKSLRSGALSYSFINNVINGMVNEISGAVDRNFTRWPILGTAVWPMNYYNHNLYVFDTHEEEIDYLKRWFKDRLTWIDSEIGTGGGNVDLTGPAIPTNFTAISYNGYVLLSWDPNSEDDIWSYSIFRGTIDNGWKDLLTNPPLDKSITNFMDTSIVANTTYYYQIAARDQSNNPSPRSSQISATTLKLHSEDLIGNYSLKQNAPNPFNSITSIIYSISNEVPVNITIFDLFGKKINILINTNQVPGEYSITWDGNDSRGCSVSSGIYLYMISAGEYRQTRKMLLLK